MLRHSPLQNLIDVKARYRLFNRDQIFFVVLYTFFIFIVLWGIKSYDDQYIRSTTLKVSNNYINALEKSLNQSLYSIDRMAKRWLVRGGTPEFEWRHDADAYLSHQQELSTLAIINHAKVEWVEPITDSKKAVVYHGQALKTIELPLHAHVNNDPLILLKQNNNQFLLLYYSKKSSVFKEDSFVAGIYDVNTLVQSSLKIENNPFFDISIHADGHEIFSLNKNIKHYGGEKFQQHDILHVKGQQWQVEVAPTEFFIKNNLLVLPKIGFIIGLALFSLMVFILYSRHRYHMQNMKLAEHERLLNLFIQKAPAAIAMLDTEFKYISASERWYLDYKIKYKNILGMKHFELFQGSHLNLDQWMHTFNRCLKGENIKVDEESFAQPDGSLLWLKYELYPWFSQGDIIGGIIIFSENISEMKKIDNVKNEFISTVSHELRTPLTSIKGSLILLCSRVTSILDQKSNRLLSISVDNCHRLSKLVDDILDMQKIAAGKLDFNYENLDLVHELQRILEHNEPLEFKYNVKFELKLPDQQKMPCYIDHYRFEQVITNLLSNAAKFSPKNSIVTVELKRFSKAAQIAVTDTGAGISNDFRDRIFQRFSQEDSSDSRSNQGTGLGLHISKSIIDAFQGSLEFTSAAGEGTTFYVTIPLASAEKIVR